MHIILGFMLQLPALSFSEEFYSTRSTIFCVSAPRLPRHMTSLCKAAARVLPIIQACTVIWDILLDFTGAFKQQLLTSYLQK